MCWLIISPLFPCSLSPLMLALYPLQGGAINLSSAGEDANWDELRGASVILRNCTFEGCTAAEDTGGVAYLNAFTSLSIQGDDNR